MWRNCLFIYVGKCVYFLVKGGYMDCFDLIGKEELHVDMTVCHKKYKYYYDIHGLIIYRIV